MLAPEDLAIAALGPRQHASPLVFQSPNHDRSAHFVPDGRRVRFNVHVKPNAEPTDDLSFEEAGPRETIFFEPSRTTAAIVTCGGLSPGLNNVIRSAFYELTENYKTRRVLGIRSGYLGLNPESGIEPVTLTSELVEPIDKLGGTVLGTSRGPQDTARMVDRLQSLGIDILFCLGGDGTQRGAHAMHEEIQRRGLPIAIVGIPKTIDNDIPYVRTTFGYMTALEKAAEVIRGAHVEAKAAVNGIALVKLMGRHAGFIAAGASVVSQEVNFTLVPEIAFPLEGEGGFLMALERRMRARHHAVVVVAEGAGQHLFAATEQQRDASGNLLSEDIGRLLGNRIKTYFAEGDFPIVLKYLDPSYYIRSVPANAL